MIDARHLMFWSSAAVVCVAGCGTSGPDAVSSKPSSVAAIAKHVTLHVPKMCERLKLMWSDWPNKVEQALSGLDGVEVEDEWDRDPEAIDLDDLLFVTYNPERISIETLLETIREQGFEAEVRWLYRTVLERQSDDKSPHSKTGTANPEDRNMTNETTTDVSDSRQAAGATNRGERVAKIGTILSAIVASSCCWLPPLLIGLGVVFGFSADRMIGVMKVSIETYRPVFMVVTFGFLGTAFYLTYRPRPVAQGCAEHCWPTTGNSGGRRFNMMTMNKVMLWGVAVMAIGFLFFPQQIMGLIMPNSSNQIFTDDMVKTVLHVKGMTWPTCEAHAEEAIAKAPGVLAVDADYNTNMAVVGTAKGVSIPRNEILAALKSIQYQGEFVDP